MDCDEEPGRSYKTGRALEPAETVLDIPVLGVHVFLQQDLHGNSEDIQSEADKDELHFPVYPYSRL